MEPKTDLLKSIYEDIYGPLDKPKVKGDKPEKMANLRELAETLSRIAHRGKPWTYRYLNSLLKGDAGFRVTPELERAFHVLLAILDDTNPLQAQTTLITTEMQMRFLNGSIQPGSIITGSSMRCTCGVLFVPHHNLQRYCTRECPGRPKRKAAKRALI